MTHRKSLLLVSLLLTLLPPPADAGDARAITLDGLLRDWTGIAPTLSDPGGDGRDGGVDLRRLWLANDASNLYLRLNVGVETVLQNPLGETRGNHLRLYLDTDGNPATGRRVGALGVEIEVRFGERAFLLYDAAGVSATESPGASGVLSLPTFSAGTFEIRVPLRRAKLPGRIRLAVEEEADGGDRMPDRGVVIYRPSRENVEPLRPLALTRRDDGDLRILSLNVEDSLITVHRALYVRLLNSLAPDVVNFQSLTAWDAEDTRAFLNTWVPHRGGGTWQAAGNADCITVSAYPILADAPVDGNLVVHVDLPDERTPHDLVLFNAHLPCCANDDGRDEEADNLARTWRDLLAGAGPFPVASDDAVVFLGDFNYVGLRRQVAAVRDGVIIDPANGEDFSPGRDDGSLAEAPLRHTHAATTYTWRRATSPFAPGRLDYVFFSKDALRLRNNYVLDTSTMPAAVLGANRLRRGDSVLMSDHLPLVTDFDFQAVP